MVDIHSAETHASGHIFPLWYHGSFTTEDWLEALEWIGDKYKDIFNYNLCLLIFQGDRNSP